MPIRGHVLVVDDDRMNRLTVLHAIKQLGHTGASAEDGQKALDMLKVHPFDVVLLDIMMPGIDGFEVLRRMKDSPELRNIPVIVISGLDELESAARSIEMGAEDYLTKPFNSILLNARIGASLERKQHRDLEQAYLQQEMMLRQSEKLATLGKLAAGMAHELNNPVASARRGVVQLADVVQGLRQATLRIAESGLSMQQHQTLANLVLTAEQAAGNDLDLDPLTVSDREAAIEAALRDYGVDKCWEYAPAIVKLGLDAQQLQDRLAGFERSHVPAVVAWISGALTLRQLLDDMGQGLAHVTQIVEALKSYSFMDQAPVQPVNVEAGLEDVLKMLPTLSNGGISVRREYAPDLPRIEAYGSELNQVWSNILDNAVLALDGSGELIVRTLRDGDGVRVEIEDDGPGIPAGDQPRIFDPFFTTRPPGQGAGLGLTISYNIVQKHSGTIEVTSQPGSTRFIVRLPANGFQYEAT